MATVKQFAKDLLAVVRSVPDYAEHRLEQVILTTHAAEVHDGGRWCLAHSHGQPVPAPCADYMEAVESRYARLTAGGRIWR